MHKCLIVENLSVGLQQKTIVHDISLEISPGEIVGLFGPNGAGKSTLISCISGIISADKGKVILNGMDVTALPFHIRARHGLGLLFQKPSVFLGMTVEQNILAALETRIKNRTERKLKLETILEQFEITHIKHSKASYLSGGETRRVELARCLACNPKLIILDEPFAGLDPIILTKIKTLVLNILTNEIGVLIVDHNIPETISMIDRGYVLVSGEVVVNGTPQEIVSNKFVRRNYLGENFQIPNTIDRE